jgi:hypothetical protein
VLKLYAEHSRLLVPPAVVLFSAVGAIGVWLTAEGGGAAYLSFLITGIVTTFFSGYVVVVATEARGDVARPGRDAAARVRAGSSELLLVGVVSTIGVYLGFVALIIPGLILSTLWAVVVPVVMFEHPGGLVALSRSRRIVEGRTWRVFGVILVLVVLVGVAASGLALAAGTRATWLGFVIRLIVGIAVAPIAGLTSVTLYQ